MSNEQEFKAELERLASLKPDQVNRSPLPPGIAMRSLGFGVRNLFSLLRIGLPLLVALAAVEILVLPQTGDLLPDGTPGEIYLDLIYTAIYATFGAVFAVAIHGWILLGVKPGPGIYFRMTGAEIKFGIATLITLLIVYSMTTVLFDLLLGTSVDDTPTEASDWRPVAAAVLFLLLFSLVLWLLARLCLVFPHVAITGQLRPGLSWSAMRGKFWRWFFIFLVLSFVTFGLMAGLMLLAAPFGVGEFAEESGRSAENMAVQAAYTLLMVVLTGFGEAVNIAALSFIYQGVTRPAEVPDGPSA